jgi:hypothetical protein
MRLRPLRLFAVAAAWAALAAAGAENQAATLFGNTSVKDFETSTFSDEGYRKMTVKGTEARYVTSDQVSCVDMNIAVYSGDAATRLDSVILSPSASFFVHEHRAEGDGAVRLIDYNHNFEMTGEGWVYTYDQKKISLARNVKVIIHAKLPDLLK